MSRSVKVDALLSRIETIKQEFAVRALSKMPDGPHAAHYHHGVIVGTEATKRALMAMLQEEDDAATRGDNIGTVRGKGVEHVYG